MRVRECQSARQQILYDLRLNFVVDKESGDDDDINKRAETICDVLKWLTEVAHVPFHDAVEWLTRPTCEEDHAARFQGPIGDADESDVARFSEDYQGRLFDTLL